MSGKGNTGNSGSSSSIAQASQVTQAGSDSNVGSFTDAALTMTQVHTPPTLTPGAVEPPVPALDSHDGSAQSLVAASSSLPIGPNGFVAFFNNAPDGQQPYNHDSLSAPGLFAGEDQLAADAADIESQGTAASTQSQDQEPEQSQGPS